MDDLIITRNAKGFVGKFKLFLYQKFHMKDLAALKYFSGLEVAHSKVGIYNSIKIVSVS